MCGINGLWTQERSILVAYVLQGMNDTIAHRGPNDEGIYVENGIGLGHRRLSIIDLSSAGHQPMVSRDKNLVLAFNGEIYNYQHIKAQLKNDYEFQTNTDTEVIIAAYLRWGKDCVDHLEGMFAFALWNKNEEELWLVRDRLGIKPLYYFQRENLLIFSSEIRALLQSGLVSRQIHSQGLHDFFRYQTVHAPDTLVKDVHMLMPGQWMSIRQADTKKHTYWQLKPNGKVQKEQSYAEICQDVRKLLVEAVEKRLVADVPFGAFLSGGIDSSVVVGIMSQVMDQVSTFSVSFEEEQFSERKYAHLVAKKYHTDHHDIILKANDFLALLPEALASMDHPSGDGPNTYVVSKVTKAAGIDMALSGLGGDELFAGYGHFKWLLSFNKWNRLNAVPQWARRMLSLPLGKLGDVRSKKISQLLLTNFSVEEMYPLTRSVLLDDTIARLTKHTALAENRVLAQVGGYERLESNRSISAITKAEISTYLQNVLLRDTDQMSMAHALEVRVPFLDHQLLEYVYSLKDPVKYPITPKKLLVDATHDLLLPEVVNRPKMGFVLPWDTWLKRELKSFADEKLQALGERHFIDAPFLQTLWAAFLKGSQYITWARIWQLVVLEAWLEKHEIDTKEV